MTFCVNQDINREGFHAQIIVVKFCKIFHHLGIYFAELYRLYIGTEHSARFVEENAQQILFALGIFAKDAQKTTC